MKAATTLACLLTAASALVLTFPRDEVLAHGGAADGHGDTHASAPAVDSEVQIVLREGQQPLIINGQHTQGHVIALVAGQPTALAFRNEDTIPREFVSP